MAIPPFCPSLPNRVSRRACLLFFSTSLQLLLLLATFSLYSTSLLPYTLFCCVLQLPQQLIVFLSEPPCWSQLLRQTAATAAPSPPSVYPEYILCPLPQYFPTYIFLSFLENRNSLSLVPTIFFFLSNYNPSPFRLGYYYSPRRYTQISLSNTPWRTRQPPKSSPQLPSSPNPQISAKSTAPGPLRLTWIPWTLLDGAMDARRSTPPPIGQSRSPGRRLTPPGLVPAGFQSYSAGRTRRRIRSKPMNSQPIIIGISRVRVTGNMLLLCSRMTIILRLKMRLGPSWRMILTWTGGFLSASSKWSFAFFVGLTVFTFSPIKVPAKLILEQRH